MLMMSSVSTFQSNLILYPFTQTGTVNGIVYRYADIPAPPDGYIMSFATVNPSITLTSPTGNLRLATNTLTFTGASYIRGLTAPVVTQS